MHITYKGEILKFGSNTIVHHEFFYMVMKEWSKEYHKNWENISTCSKHRALQHLHRRFLNLQFVRNGAFIYSLKLSIGEETYKVKYVQISLLCTHSCF
jgi:hypothetical protein